MQKRTAALLGSMLLCAGLLFAQAPATDQQQPTDPQTGQSKPMQQGARPGMRGLAQMLNLSQDQVAQIKPILAEQREQIQAIRADTSLSPEDRQTRLKSVRQDARGKIEALLNDSQKQQYEQMLAEQLRASPSTAQAQRLAKELGLNQEQVAQIKPILAKQIEEIQALRADTSLSAKDRKTKVDAVRQDAKGKIETLLNDSQKQQYEQIFADQLRVAPAAAQSQWLARKLSLSQDQVAQIKPILAKQIEEIQALRADTSLSAKDRQTRVEAVRQDAKGKIEALLNDSQKQQFEQMSAARRERQQQRRNQQQQPQTRPGI
jgi:hypothetical protein